MTLQVQQLLAPHIANLLDLHTVQAAAAGSEVFDPVDVASRVNPRRFVPALSVELEFFTHGSSPFEFE
jgi:hypothetical protein